MKTAPDTFHADSWLVKMMDRDNTARLKEASGILNSLANKSSEAKGIVSSLQDRKEFIKPSLVPYFYYIPLNRTLDDRLMHLKFKTPMVGVKHKRLPLIMIAGKSGAKSENVVPMDYVERFGKQENSPKHFLSYARPLTRMGKEAKLKLYDLSLDGMRSYRKDNPKKSGWFSDYLENNKDFVLKGYVVNYSYINLDPKYGETAPVWVHPWGLPSMLYAHKRLPIYMLTGPAHRLDENILGQRNMVGHTG